MSETRIPKQKRSIEKRNKIISEGFKLMCEQGYYNVNTNDIAKYAGVSTGIIYQYFNDKKEIFIEGIKTYSDNIMFPILEVLKNNVIKIDNLEELLNQMLDIFIKKHTLSKKAHEEMLAMSHLDQDIANIFKKREIDTTKAIINTLNENNLTSENIFEKVHIIIGIVENYCHEVVYHHHQTMNYDIMKKEIIKIITNVLTQ